MINFSQEKNVAKALWDGVYKNQMCTLFWEEQKWVAKCARWLFDTVDLELKTKNYSCNLLDYACGNGVYFDYIKELSNDIEVSITGVDVSTVAIGNAKQKSIDIAQSLAQKACHINVIEEPIFLPEEIGRCDFDVAICWSTIHHIDRSVLGRCIKGFYDSLQKDGLLIVSGWGQSANRYKIDSGRSPVTSAQCWPIGGIKSLLLRYFSIERHEYIPHDEEPDDAFEIFVCRKKNLTLLQRYENDLIVYLHDVGQDISFFHLYRYQISQNLMAGEMDRRSSFAFYRDESEMVETFECFVQQLRAGCGNKVFFFTRDIYSMRQKKHLIAFYDKGASAQNLVVKDTGFSTIYDFRLPNRIMADECHVAYKPIEAMTIAELYEKISYVDVVSNNSTQKINFPDDFAERFYYGLNQNRDIGVYFFVCSSDEERNTSIGDGGLVLYTKKRLSNDVVHMIDSLVSKWTATLTTKSFKTIFKDKAIQSAVGSIMSRNGSHNIGSHVLAALSHNVGTLPDDRVLYQYIQQRMDYIATVTTDFPTWTQPTMFVADMMKTFLSQRHLLDHIVESEGLKAFQFQNPNMTDEEWEKQENCVKIYVRKLDGDGSVEDFIEYEKGNRETPIDLTNDVALAIPGGIVGEHAFYTILENIIRNAAKHSWADAEVRSGCKNLDLYIDFREDDQHDKVIFNVYAALPIKGNLNEDSSFNVKSWINKYDKSGGLTSDEQEKFDSLAIHHKQQVMLARPFIDSQGALRLENWGMAEMKISAGYLAGESIEAIGGIGDKKRSNEIITPYIKSETVKRTCVKAGENEKIIEVEVKEQYLGYKFSIAKPKEILIIVKNKNENEWNDKNGVMKKSGIFVKTIKEAKEELKLNYRYIVHYDATEFFDLETKEPKEGILIPFRMLSAKKEPENKKDENEKISDWSWLQRFVADLDDGIEKDKKKKNGNGFEQLKKSFENGLVDNVRKIVYKAYSEHLRKSRNKDEIKEIGLLVAINENEKSGGNSLISDADILELMMEQNFAVCIDQYDALAQNENSHSTIKLLHSIKNSSNDDRNVVKFKYVQGRTIRELIAQRLYNWICNNSDINNDEIRRHLKQKYYAIEKKEIDEAKQDNDGGNNDDFARGVNALLSRHPIDDFIRYAESVFENTKKLFKQYEEQIVTLPAGYKVQSSNVGEGESLIDGIKIITSAEKKELEKEKDRHWIGYRRHAHTLPVDDSKRLYVEPLSGTQTYLSQLARVKTDLGLQMRLIENGLMRILVLDERVAKFLREHQKEVGPHYKSMNIHVIDHEWVVAGGETPPEGFYGKFTSVHKEALKSFVKPQEPNDGENNQNGNADVSSNSNLTMFDDVDILIVHQGILDKWYPEFKNRKDMGKLLEGFKKLVKYVVVTTGRGTPENIPEEAHLLPFAVVESTLFKKYPEKLILTDTIMNVLPVGKKNNNSGGQG